MDLGMFLRLESARDHAIETAASVYGLIGTCEHGRPARHRLLDPAEAHRGACPLPGGTLGREPLAVWRRLAGGMSALLRLGRGPEQDPGVQRELASWIELGDVRPVFELTHDGLALVTFEGSGLLGALCRDLARVVAGGRLAATCDACHTIFFPQQRRAGRRTYCRDCGHRAAMRDAARDYRRDNLAEVRRRDRERKRALRASAR